MQTDYSFDGLDEIEQQLAQMIEQTYPAEFEAMIKQLASELRDKVKVKTPKDTSHLSDSWTVGELVKRGDEYYIEVFNNVEYAEPVEYGHRTRGGKGFIPGAHMMEISLTELDKELTPFLRDWLSNFISTHDL